MSTGAGDPSVRGKVVITIQCGRCGWHHDPLVGIKASIAGVAIHLAHVHGVALPPSLDELVATHQAPTADEVIA